MPLGAVPARLAAIERGELDGMVIESATGYELEEQGKGARSLLFGDIEKHFYTHVIFATDDMIEKRADLLRRFLRGWFKTVAFMKANKAAAVKSGAKVVKVRESIVSKVYDTQIGSFSTDGAWDTQCDRRHPQFAQGSRHPRLRPGGEGDLQRQVRPGEVLT